MCVSNSLIQASKRNIIYKATQTVFQQHHLHAYKKSIGLWPFAKRRASAKNEMTLVDYFVMNNLGR